MSQVLTRGPRSPEMNMTPMIDIVFQLIIFFMLVNNIIAEEAVEMIVPKLYDPKVRVLEDQERITVNVMPREYQRDQRSENPWKWDGDAVGVKVGLTPYSIQDLDKLTADLKAVKEKKPNVEVVLRVDGAIYYQNVQPILNSITLAGIEKINLVAYMPNQGPDALVK